MPKMFKTVKYMQKVVAEIVLKRNMDLFNSAQALIINIYVFISFFFYSSGGKKVWCKYLGLKRVLGFLTESLLNKLIHIKYLLIYSWIFTRTKTL